ANWLMQVAPTPRMPPLNGGNNQTITIDVPLGGQTISEVNQTAVGMPFFEMRQLIYAANCVGTSLIGGANNTVLRFSNNPSIVLTSPNVIHDINNQIALNAHLTVNGAGANSQIQLLGRITPGTAANAGITINIAATSSVYMSGTGTLANLTDSNFTGGVNLQSGILAIGRGAAAANGNPTTNALGSGVLGIGGANTIVRAGDGETVSVANAVGCGADTNFGEAGFSGRLRFTGLFNTNVAANATRRINLGGGIDHILDLGGNIQHVDDAILELRGDTAPVVVNGAIRNKNVNGQRKADSVGSQIVWSGATTTLHGDVNVLTATLNMSGTIGAANNRSTSQITIGEPRAAATPNVAAPAAAVIGRSLANGARVAVNPARVFFAATGRLHVHRDSVFAPGGSPGIMAINGGAVDMEPGAGFSVTLNGAAPGNGDGFYGQLLLEEDAAMNLMVDGSGLRPVLGIDLQTWDSAGATNFVPSIGMSFTIIDQDSSAAPSLYAPAMTSIDGSMFMSHDGGSLAQGVYFGHEALPAGTFFQIDYFGGDTGNDVVLTIVPIPAPGAASVAALAGLVTLRRRRR
ncbi:MAG TPA: hypothetical protein VFF65_08070, partial [Phycisphaerales bacterium]|nr:hypothetical protein [Phycisphaerales bacterium]